ncbi:GNAT family N-acetyltransferase [Acinetobacter gerneri]|uniref:GNAT family N-acetyltransferase n=1 Tax=Acinetobacter gerneri TaxID=202952 RepID=UPI003A8C523D
MNFNIRLAQIDDLEAVLAIFNREIETGTANWRNTQLSLAEYQQWYADLLQDNFPLYVAVETTGQRIAGFADYSAFRSLVGYKQTVEHSVFIHPDFARQGLGKKLMQQLISHAKQQQIHVMVAAIDAENISSIQLHERLGFKQCGYMPQVGQKFAQWRDLILLQLILDDHAPLN